MTAIAHAPPSLDGPPRGAPAPTAWGLRLATGLAGILLAAVMSGLNNRVGSLGLADVAGARGMSADTAHWFGSAYAAAELAAMPIAPWFAGTFSLRRLHLGASAVFIICALLLPLAPNPPWFFALRTLQGFAGGVLIPLLMSAALRFLPPSIKLHGFGLYALTATFAPNLATWLAASWMDGAADWRLVYWQALPAGLLVLAAVSWGIPQDPLRLSRLRDLDWLALLTGPAGLVLLALALQEGERLDWLNSPLIAGMFVSGTALVVTFLISGWFHHLPFIRLQLLGRLNIGLGIALFIGLLLVVAVTSLLPVSLLTGVHGFRPQQLMSIGLVISLPQLVLSPAISALLYWRRLDARCVAVAGFFLLALAAWLGSGVTSQWMAAQFWLSQACLAVGQPLVLISLLFISTGVAAPMEGQFISGLVNMVFTLVRLVGATGAAQLLESGQAAYVEQISGMAVDLVDLPASGSAMLNRLLPEAVTLATADIYYLTALLALALAPLPLFLTYIPPPASPRSNED